MPVLFPAALDLIAETDWLAKTLRTQRCALWTWDGMANSTALIFGGRKDTPSIHQGRGELQARCYA